LRKNCAFLFASGVATAIIGYLWNKSGKVEEKSWNYNWDERQDGFPDTQRDEAGRYLRSNGKRTITLVRHGQYQKTNSQDPTYRSGINNTASLTDTGIEQAKETGRRLNNMGVKFDQIYCSKFTRAMETAYHLVSGLELNDVSEIQYDSDLNEGLASKIEPYTFQSKPYGDFLKEMDETHERIDRAFKKYIHRRDNIQSTNNREDILIVGHANTSRYFIAKALQLPLNTWARFNMNNASYSRIYAYDDGVVNIQHIGDSGHMEKKLLTDNKHAESI